MGNSDGVCGDGVMISSGSGGSDCAGGGDWFVVIGSGCEDDWSRTGCGCVGSDWIDLVDGVAHNDVVVDDDDVVVDVVVDDVVDNAVDGAVDVGGGKVGGAFSSLQRIIVDSVDSHSIDLVSSLTPLPICSLIFSTTVLNCGR